MTPDDVISKLRADLEKLSGPARAERLFTLAMALRNRYWRTGMGRPDGIGDLDAGIAAINEAYSYLEAGDAFRGHAAGLLGMMLGRRHTRHGGTVEDRDRGIQTIQEALAFPSLPPMQVTMLRFQLGQLYYTRAFDGENHQAMLSSMMGGGGTPWVGDVDRANDCFRAVLAAGPVSREITEAARTMLDVGEATAQVLIVQPGQPSGSGMAQLTAPMTRTQEAIAKLQNLIEQSAGRTPFGGMSLFDLADALTSRDPIDRHVMVFHGEAPEGPVPQPIPRPEPVPLDRDALRDMLHTKLSEVAGGTGRIWDLAAGLLHPGAAMPDTDTVDELVALSTLVVEEKADGLDWFVHAVTLGLRARLEDTGGGEDRAAGAEGILRAVQAIPEHDPAAITIFGALGAFLDGALPWGGLDAAAAGAYADRVDSIMVSGAVRSGADLATLHALRCLCRASTGEAADVQRAVGTVPLEYPWLATLKAITSAGSVPR